MHSFTHQPLLAGVLLGVIAPFASAAALISYVGGDDGTGMSLATVVAPCPLIHTTQVLPQDGSGQLVGKDNVGQQIVAVLAHLEIALFKCGSGLDRAVKLNVYVVKEDDVAQVTTRLARRFSGPAKPAVSFVVTELPHPGARVAMDAVAATSVANPAVTVSLQRVPHVAARPGAAHLGVLPPGDVVYVSGQAETGDLPEATAKTLDSLIKTLAYLGLDQRHVVHVKAFMKPIGQAGVVHRELVKAFEGRLAPPMSLVEWTSSSPIEIELIAYAPSDASGSQSGDRVTYITPPGTKASPVYSKVTRVYGGKRVYVSGLYAGKPGPAPDQIHDIFGQLKQTLSAAGSDLRHLAKATYYVSDDDASRQLNAIRPDYYDPKRPPAASKAMVSAVGRPGRTITLDMIGVTTK